MLHSLVEVETKRPRERMGFRPAETNSLFCMETDPYIQWEPRRSGPDIKRLLMALGLGFLLGWLGSSGCAISKTDRDFRLMSQAWSLINRHYVDRSAVKPESMTYGAIQGMVDSLGDTGHSSFLTPEMVKQLQDMEHGEYKGIGVEIRMKDGHVVIVAPLQGSPAQHAGLRSGEIITKVSDRDITDWPLSQVIEQISGPPGTPVTLTVEDPQSGRNRKVTLVRAAIRIRDVAWRWLPGAKIAHLRLASFGGQATSDLREALKTILKEGAKGIILDLRDNPGGILEQAVGVASQFLEKGNVVLMKDAKGHIKPVPVQKGGLAIDIPLVALINQGSASAAEIVAGALKDANRALLVGQTTFGTGTVLGQFQLSDGSEVLLAIEEWLTPKGHSFWHKGISPEVAVELPDEATPLFPEQESGMTTQQFESSPDRQLHRALDLLINPGHISSEERVSDEEANPR